MLKTSCRCRWCGEVYPAGAEVDADRNDFRFTLSDIHKTVFPSQCLLFLCWDTPLFFALLFGYSSPCFVHLILTITPSHL